MYYYGKSIISTAPHSTILCLIIYRSHDALETWTILRYTLYLSYLVTLNRNDKYISHTQPERSKIFQKTSSRMKLKKNSHQRPSLQRQRQVIFKALKTLVTGRLPNFWTLVSGSCRDLKKIGEGQRCQGAEFFFFPSNRHRHETCFCSIPAYLACTASNSTAK